MPAVHLAKDKKCLFRKESQVCFVNYIHNMRPDLKWMSLSIVSQLLKSSHLHLPLYVLHIENILLKKTKNQKNKQKNHTNQQKPLNLINYCW